MTLLDHIRELRTRLFVVALIFVVGSTIAYVYKDQVLHLLLAPLNGQKLVYLNVAGGFNFVFLVSIYAGLALAAPILIHQLYEFMRPTLPLKMQKYSLRILSASLILLVCGALFGYFFAIPQALHFLYGFAGRYVESSLTADSYLNFVISYTLGLGIVFQLPLFLLFIHWIKPLSPGGLLRSERWIILLSFIVAAVVNPNPDPMNQVIMALPIICIYQFGVAAVLISIMRARQSRKQAEQRVRRIIDTPVQFTHPKPYTAPASLVVRKAGRPINRPSVGMQPRQPASRIVPRTVVPKAAPQYAVPPASIMKSSSARFPKRGHRQRTIDGIIPRMPAASS